MKKYVILGFILSFGVLTLPAFAEGRYNPGTVQVIDMGSSKILFGAYNVRYNPAVSSSVGGYIAMVYNPGGGMTITAKDSATGIVASCNIAPTDALFAGSEKMAAMAGNGSQIWAQMTTSTSKCIGLSITAGSHHLD